MLCLFYLSPIRTTSVHFTIHDMTTNLNHKLKYSELVTEGRFAEREWWVSYCTNQYRIRQTAGIIPERYRWDCFNLNKTSTILDLWSGNICIGLKDIPEGLCWTHRLIWILNLGSEKDSSKSAPIDASLCYSWHREKVWISTLGKYTAIDLNRLLEHCRAVIPEGGVILLAEFVILCYHSTTSVLFHRCKFFCDTLI